MDLSPDGGYPEATRWRSRPEQPATARCHFSLLMTRRTGDPKYKQAAVRAAEYVWVNWGKRGLFIGGASDNPNITDKEAGMLSMEAFLSLYESTKDPEWLERAKTAGRLRRKLDLDMESADAGGC